MSPWTTLQFLQDSPSPLLPPYIPPPAPSPPPSSTEAAASCFVSLLCLVLGFTFKFGFVWGTGVQGQREDVRGEGDACCESYKESMKETLKFEQCACFC